jgi:phosphoribosylformimino-5-aminoimidazole carboxamide ribotide isomerase
MQQQQVIITSFLFPSGTFSQPRLDAVLAALDGDKSKLVIDLSCRRHDGDDEQERWFVAMDKWQTITDMEVCEGMESPAPDLLIPPFPHPNPASFLLLESIKRLEPYCSEFLIHAADNEGLQRGVDEKLVERLAQWCSIPVTYAGGGRNLEDLERVKELSGGKVDLTIGSALDCFGGSGVTLAECVEWNRRQEE